MLESDFVLDATPLNRSSLRTAIERACQGTIWQLLDQAASRWPDNVAVIDPWRQWTYEELRTAARRCANRLHALGVTQGARVAVLMPAVGPWVVLHYALARIGAVTVPLNPWLAAPELSSLLERAKPEMTIAAEWIGNVAMGQMLRDITPGHSGARYLLETDDDGRFSEGPVYEQIFGQRSDTTEGPPPAPVGPSDSAMVLFTSGSTATPKAARVSSAATLGAGVGVVHGLSVTDSDRWLGLNPTFHTASITYMLTAPHLAGAATCLLGVFDADDAVAAIERHRCSVTIGFDTLFTRMAEASVGRDVSSLARVAIGGSPAFVQHLVETSNFRFSRISGVYGSTESSALLAITPPEHAARGRGMEANGRVLPGVDVRIVDPETHERLPHGQRGEIAYRGWIRVLGYGFDAADSASELGEGDDAASVAFDELGYFYSGDQGVLDSDGTLSFTGRYAQIIKTGGENVSALEVARLVETHLKEVEMAVVVGVANPDWGEAVIAFVQLRDGVVADSDAFRSRLRGLMSGYKVPKRFISVPPGMWPLLDNGRVDVRALRDLAAR